MNISKVRKDNIVTEILWYRGYTKEASISEEEQQQRNYLKTLSDDELIILLIREFRKLIYKV